MGKWVTKEQMRWPSKKWKKTTVWIWTRQWRNNNGTVQLATCTMPHEHVLIENQELPDSTWVWLLILWKALCNNELQTTCRILHKMHCDRSASIKGLVQVKPCQHDLEQSAPPWWLSMEPAIHTEARHPWASSMDHAVLMMHLPCWKSPNRVEKHNKQSCGLWLSLTCNRPCLKWPHGPSWKSKSRCDAVVTGPFFVTSWTPDPQRTSNLWKKLRCYTVGQLWGDFLDPLVPQSWGVTL